MNVIKFVLNVMTQRKSQPLTALWQSLKKNIEQMNTEHGTDEVWEDSSVIQYSLFIPTYK
jgi:hypothetical protein